MSKERILVVEDDGILAAHLEKTLEQLGYQVTGLVSSGQDALQAALTQKPDAILMDIHLRGEMSGIQAAAEIHQQNNIPVVYLTAYTDEILLQQAKITDAYAYLAKPVRERELRASLEMALYKHGVEKHLEQLNQVLRAIRNVNQIIAREHEIQPLLDAICRTLVNTYGYQLVWVGQLAESHAVPLAWAGEGQAFLELVTGSSSPLQVQSLPCAAAMRSRQPAICSDMLHDARYAPWQEAVEKQGFASSASIPMLYGENLVGTLCIYSRQAAFFDDEQVQLLLEMAGDIALAICKIEDEMARRLAEETLIRSEEKYRLLVENINEVIFLTDTRGLLTYVSPAIGHIFQYTPMALIGQSIFVFVHPDDQAALREKFPLILAGENRVSEYRFLDRDGSIHHVRTSSRAIMHDGVVSGMTTLMSDITAYKQLEAGLSASEERFRHVAENAGEWIWEVDADGLYTYANPVVEQILGYRPEELVGKKHFYDLFAPLKRQALKETAFASFVRRLSFRHFINDNIAKDGHLVILETNGTPLVDEQGRLKGYRGADRDITASKLAEEAVQSSEARLKAIFNASGILMAMIDVEGYYLQVNQAFIQLTGYDLPELEHLTYIDLLHPDDIGSTLKNMDLLLKQEKRTSRRQVRFLHQNGSVIWVDLSTTSILDAEGHISAFVGAGFDISERKRTEEALSESEQRFRSIVDNTEAGYFFFDTAGFIQDVNPAWVKLYGYHSVEEILGHHFTEIQQEDDIESAKAFVAGILRGDSRFISGEFSRKCKDGSLGYHTFTARPVSHKGEVVGIEGFIIDSTERKRTEKLLKESEAHYQTLVEGTPGIIYSFSNQRGGLYYSPRVMDILGYSPEQMLAQPMLWHDSIHPDDQARADQSVYLAKMDKAFELEYRILDANGTWHWFNDRSIRHQVAENEIIIEGLVLDVTERRQAEEAMQRYQLLVQTSSDIILFIHFPDGKILDANQAALEAYGYSPSELLNLHLTDLRAPNAAPEMVETMNAAYQKGLRFESLHRRKNGAVFPVDISSRGVTLNNEPVLLSIIRDASERKQTELALLEGEQKYRTLVEAMTEGVALHSLIYDEAGEAVDYRIEEINPAFEQQVGIDAEHARGTAASQLYGVTPAPYLDVYTRVAQTGQPVYFQTYFAPLGRYFDISVISPRPGWFATIFTNITVRKNTENDLLVSKQRYESLFQYSPIPLLEVDFSGLKPFLSGMNTGDEAEMQSYMQAHPFAMHQFLEKIQVIDINQAGLAFFNGHNKTDFLRQPSFFGNIFKSGNLIHKLLMLLSRQQDMFEDEFNFQIPGQEEHWVKIFLAIDPQYSATLERGLISLTDLTARKHAEDVLRQAEARFRSLFENMSQGVFYIDETAHIILVNPAAQRIFGVKAEDMLGRRMDDARWQRLREDGSVMPANETAAAWAIQSGKAVEHRIIANYNPKIQDYRWLDITAIPQFRPGEKHPYQTYVIFEDITERRRVEKEKEDLLEQTRQQAERLTAVLQISSSLRQAQVESDVLQILMEQSSQGLKAEAVLLGLIENGELVFNLGTDEWAALSGAKQDLDRRLNQLLLNGQPLSYHSRGEMRRARLPAALQSILKGFESCLLIPFKVVDAPIGLLVAGYHHSLEKSADRLSLAAAIGEIAGITLQRMRLLDSLERLAAERARDLTGLYNVVSASSGSLDIDAVLKQVLLQVLYIMDAEDGAILSIDPAQQQFRMMSVVGLEESRDFLSALPLNSKLEGWVVEHGEPLLIANINQDARFNVYPGMQQTNYAYMALPMRTRSVVKGVLIILRKELPFNLEEITLIGSIADHIALIIDNLTLYQLYEQAAVLEERARLARDLHDSASQSLYSVTLYAEASRAMVEKGDLAQTRQYLDRLTQTARLALQEMRLLVYELRPLSLEQDGLSIALRKRLESVEGRAGIKTHVDILDLVQLNRQQEEHLFWIAVEALNNSLRHAAASQVDIKLKTVDNEIIFSIKDNGKGFDFESGLQSGGMGLQNIQARAQKIGARIEINTAPGSGTAVIIYLPLPGTTA